MSGSVTTGVFLSVEEAESGKWGTCLSSGGNLSFFLSIYEQSNNMSIEGKVILGSE